MFGITCWEIQIFHSSELFTNDHETLLILELQITFSKQEYMHIWNLQIMRMDCVCYIYYLCVRVTVMFTVFPPNKMETSRLGFLSVYLTRMSPVPRIVAGILNNVE